MKKILKWVVIIFIALIVIGLIFGNDDAKETAPTETATVSNDETAKTTEESSETTATAEPEIKLTSQQKNAIRSAEQYLNTMPFSRDGLITQLSASVGGGYSKEDATIAVDSLDVDWNEQAEKSAQQYLDMQGFSCDGLITQLSSTAGSKYTKEQAEHGAKAVGACD